jgi:hypothetical protein
MKRSATIFLQAVIVLIGVVTLITMFRFPLTEGAAVGKDLLSIYTDPFILYGYAVSIAWYYALYQAFQLLGYIGQQTVFSEGAIHTLRAIKYCALIVSLGVVLAALYIRMFHAQDDDPAGFVAVAIITTFLSLVVATAATVFERILQKAVDIQAENDLTV